MKKSRLPLLGCIAVALLTPARAARADPLPLGESTEVEALTDKARQLYLEGLIALEKSQWVEAYASTLAAWRIKTQYQIAANLGFSEVRLGKYRDAAEHLTYYLREAPAKKVQERQHAQALLNEALINVAVVKVVVEPAGAEVLVNGASVGRSPLVDSLFLNPGASVIEARQGGYDAAKRPIVAVAGATMNLDIRLEKPAVTKPLVQQEPESLTSYLLVLGSTVAGMGLGAGISFTIIANSKASRASTVGNALVAQQGEQACLAKSSTAGCDEVHGMQQDADFFGNVALWSFLGAGVVGAGTLGCALVKPCREGGSSVQAVPLISASGGGVMLSGSW